MTFKKKTQGTDVLVNFVLDASGSMGHLTKATIDGFNRFIQDQVDLADGEIYVSLTLFNSAFDVRYTACPASDVSALGSAANPYRPTGGTALLDAVGVAVTGAEEWLRRNADFDGQVVTVVWTDGGENSSSRFTRHTINSLIETKQEQGWVFQFMGTGESGWLQNTFLDAIPVANRGLTINSGAGMQGGFFGLSSSIGTLRSTGGYSYSQDLVDQATSSAAA